MEPHPLQSYRERQNMTQCALARALGVTEGTISRWESGVRNIGPRQVRRVATLTGIAVEELRPDLYATEAAE